MKTTVRTIECRHCSKMILRVDDARSNGNRQAYLNPESRPRWVMVEDPEFGVQAQRVDTYTFHNCRKAKIQ